MLENNACIMTDISCKMHGHTGVQSSIGATQQKVELIPVISRFGMKPCPRIQMGEAPVQRG